MKINTKRIDQLMFKCNRDAELKASQRQFIDPALMQLKKQNMSEYKRLTRKHHWIVFIY